MEILGIGPLELVFILVIALIVLGPKDMAKAGLTVGRFLRKIVTSPTWGTIRRTSKEIKYLPNRLMKEAGLEDDEIQDIAKGLSIPEMDRSIYNPRYQGGKKPGQPSEPAPIKNPQPGDSPAEFSAWTSGCVPSEPADPSGTPPEGQPTISS
jgi:hypothetical protein